MHQSRVEEAGKEMASSVLHKLLIQLGLPETAAALVSEIERTQTHPQVEKDQILYDAEMLRVLEQFVITPTACQLREGTKLAGRTAAAAFQLSKNCVVDGSVCHAVTCAVWEFLVVDAPTEFEEGFLWDAYAALYQLAAPPNNATGSSVDMLRHLEGVAALLEQRRRRLSSTQSNGGEAVLAKLIGKRKAPPAPPHIAELTSDACCLLGRLRRFCFLCLLTDALGAVPTTVLPLSSILLQSLHSASDASRDDATRASLHSLGASVALSPAALSADRPLISLVNEIESIVPGAAIRPAANVSAPEVGVEASSDEAGQTITFDQPTCIFNFGLRDDVATRLSAVLPQSENETCEDEAPACQSPSDVEGEIEQEQLAADDEEEECEVDVSLPEEPQDVAASSCGTFWAIVTSRMRLIILRAGETSGLEVIHVLDQDEADGPCRKTNGCLRFSPSDSSLLLAGDMQRRESLAVLFADLSDESSGLRCDAMIVDGIGGELAVTRRRVHPVGSCGIHAGCFVQQRSASQSPGHNSALSDELLTAGDTSVLRWVVSTGIVLQRIGLPNCLDVHFSLLTSSIYLIDTGGFMSVLDAHDTEDVTHLTPVARRVSAVPGCRRDGAASSDLFAGTVVPLWERAAAVCGDAEVDCRVDAELGAELIRRAVMRNVPPSFLPKKRDRKDHAWAERVRSGTRIVYTFPSDDSAREPPRTSASVAALGIESREIVGRTLLSFVTKRLDRPLERCTSHSDRLLVILAADDTTRVAPVAHPSRLLGGYYLAIVFDTLLGQTLREIALCPLLPNARFLALPCERRLACARPLRERIMVLRGTHVPSTCCEDEALMVVGGPGQMLYVIDASSGKRQQVIDLNRLGENTTTNVGDDAESSPGDRAVLEWGRRLVSLPPATPPDSMWLHRVREIGTKRDEKVVAPSSSDDGDLSALLSIPADATSQLITTMNAMGVVTGVACSSTCGSARLRLMCCDELGLCFAAGFDLKK